MTHEEVDRLEIQLDTKRFQPCGFKHVGNEPCHLLGLLRNTSERCAAIRLGQHPLAQHRCVSSNDPQRTAQLVSGDIQKLALEAFEPAAALGLLLEVDSCHRLADPMADEAREPKPDFPPVIVKRLPAGQLQQPDHCAVGVNRDEDLISPGCDLPGCDRTLKIRPACQAIRTGDRSL